MTFSIYAKSRYNVIYFFLILSIYEVILLQSDHCLICEYVESNLICMFDKKKKTLFSERAGNPLSAHFTVHHGTIARGGPGQGQELLAKELDGGIAGTQFYF